MLVSFKTIVSFFAVVFVGTKNELTGVGYVVITSGVSFMDWLIGFVILSP